MLSKLQINNQTIERVESIRFLGFLLDKCLSWKRHIKYIENNVSKDIGFLYKAKTVCASKIHISTILFSRPHLLIIYLYHCLFFSDLHLY